MYSDMTWYMNQNEALKIRKIANAAVTGGAEQVQRCNYGCVFMTSRTILATQKTPLSASSQAVCVTRFDQRMRHLWVIRAVFRGICGEIFALFQVRVGNLDAIPPWKVVGTLYLNSNCVSFKYFAFLSVCDKFELLGHDDLSVIFTVLLGFIAGYCLRFYRIISVNLLLQPFFFANFGVYPC